MGSLITLRVTYLSSNQQTQVVDDNLIAGSLTRQTHLCRAFLYLVALNEGGFLRRVGLVN